MPFKQRLRTYYYLAKPGIVYGNALMAIAGYFFGAAGAPHLMQFLAMLSGICAVMASACVYNNIIDRRIDVQMERTNKRAIVTGAVSTRNGYIYATVLLLLGMALLWFGTNPLTLLIALGGHFAYVVLYGVAKRRTVHGTLVGTISGATPPLIGYVAATGQIDTAGLLLFFILVAWQMPHFYAIAIFRRDDYARAGIPVLSVVKGLVATRQQIVAYVGLFLIACVLLGAYGGASLLTTLIMVLVAMYWLYLCLDTLPSAEQVNGWARRQFGWSLIVLMVLSASWSFDSFLH